jgi:enterochelin esterase-like enzyme
MSESRCLARCASPALATALLVLSATSVAGQQPAQGRGTLERITVHGRSLEGNLEGDSPDRPVIVYLPPGYAANTGQRYPVLYFLHGYGATAEVYAKVLALPDSIDRAIAAGSRPMIVVLPDANTKYGGSMFSNSPTIGDWETFIAQELPAFIDSRYRTIASRDGRGLAGHSMGGYGTMRVGMKQPSAFAALYAMSSCCLMNDPAAGRGAGPARGDGAPARGDGARGNATPGRGDGPAGGEAGAGRGAAAGRGAGGRGGGFGNALSAQAAAWAPNTTNAPEYFDLPTKDGQIQPLIAGKWQANSPLLMVDQHVPALRTMRAIALDIGDQDPFVGTNRQLSDALTRLGISNSFEIYPGDHMSGVRGRFETALLPFFSRQLAVTTR